MPDIIFETSAWWLVPIGILSVLLALWLYDKNTNLQRGQRALLTLLRFSIFFLAGLLLLSPLVRQEEERIEKPFLVWLTDHSLSVISAVDSIQVDALYQDLPDLSEPLRERYRLAIQSFSSDLLADQDSFDASGTNVEKALLEIQDRYYNRNLAGVVLVSDGIYNEGSDPAFIAEQLPFPVQSLLTGDTTRVKDLAVERVVHNKVSYLNNEFPVEVYVRGRGLEGEEYRIRILGPLGNTLIDETYSVDGADYFRRLSYFLKAKEEGFQRYSVILESSTAEPVNNNRSVFSIEVLSDRKQVLILGSSPHPDMAALGNAIRSAERYEVTSLVDAELPQDKTFDLVVLHQPSAEVLAEIDNSEQAYWLFLGEDTQTADYAPLKAGNKGYEESEVFVNNQFDLFTLTPDHLELLGELPPLWAPFGSPELTGDYFPYVIQKDR
jgi:hypothetical protein